MTLLHNLKYPEYNSWDVILSDIHAASELFSSKTMKKIRRGLELLSEAGYTMETVAATPEVVAEFDVLYKANMKKKNSNRVVDLTKRIAETPDFRQYLFLLLKKDNRIIGGLMHHYSSVMDQVCFTVVKFFPDVLEDVKLPISPTYLAEYTFFQQAIEKGSPRIIHGKDMNVYGKNSAIGLAMFKTLLGAIPRPTKYTTMLPLEQLEMTEEDTFVFIANEDEEDRYFKKALLFSDKDPEVLHEKYRVLFENKYYTTEIIPATQA